MAGAGESALRTPMSEPVQLDLLVVGSGVAGLSAAARGGRGGAGHAGRRAVQGRAVGLGHPVGPGRRGRRPLKRGRRAAPGDSVDLHVADTLAAGAGLCDAAAVEVLVSEGPARVRELVGPGRRVRPQRPAACGSWPGKVATRRPGWCTPAARPPAPRSSGPWSTAARQTAAQLWEGWFALDLIVEGGRCRGVIALDPDGAAGRAPGRPHAAGHRRGRPAVRGHHQPAAVDRRRPGHGAAGRRGRGRRGVRPVPPHRPARPAAGAPAPASRRRCGARAPCCATTHGQRFVDELAAPRRGRRRHGRPHAGAGRRPRVARRHRRRGLRPPLPDPGRGRCGRSASTPPATGCPVAPAAHYLCGGVLTDLDGATALPGLWAAGEVACTGVHGANRLASNSLLEGMVFGARVVEAVLGGKDGPRRRPAPSAPSSQPGASASRATIGAVRLPTGPTRVGRSADRPGRRRRRQGRASQLQRAMTARRRRGPQRRLARRGRGRPGRLARSVRHAPASGGARQPARGGRRPGAPRRPPGRRAGAHTAVRTSPRRPRPFPSRFVQ